MVALGGASLLRLIGVNDVVQGVSEATYRDNVAYILDDLLGRLPVTRIVVVATPMLTPNTIAAAIRPPMPGPAANTADAAAASTQPAGTRTATRENFRRRFVA